MVSNVAARKETRTKGRLTLNSGETAFPYCATLLLPYPSKSGSWTSFGCRMSSARTIILADSPQTNGVSGTGSTIIGSASSATDSDVAAPSIATTLPASGSTGLSSDIVTATDTSAATGISDVSSGSSTGTDVVSKSSSNVGAIAGGVVGGVIALLLIALAAFFVIRKKRRNSNPQNEKDRLYTLHGGSKRQKEEDEMHMNDMGPVSGKHAPDEHKPQELDSTRRRFGPIPQELNAMKRASKEMPQELAVDGPPLKPNSQISELPG